jgi:hypothetical protein
MLSLISPSVFLFVLVDSIRLRMVAWRIFYFLVFLGHRSYVRKFQILLPDYIPCAKANFKLFIVFIG